MNADSVCHLVRSIRKALTLEPHAEISIDVEPITVCTPSLTDWTSCGINRVNLAAVSVHDDELRAMGAAHTREQLQNALLFLGKFHMSRVSIELMYGLPRQTRASWEHTLLTVADLGYPHIRVTPLVDRHTGGAANAEVANANTTNAEVTSEQNRAASLPSIEDRRSWYELACTTLTSRGYEQYAVDSFVSTSAPHGRDRFDKHARNGADVLGLGAGAHSRIDGFAYATVERCVCTCSTRQSSRPIVRNPARIDHRGAERSACQGIVREPLDAGAFRAGGGAGFRAREVAKQQDSETCARCEAGRLQRGPRHASARRGPRCHDSLSRKRRAHQRM